MVHRIDRHWLNATIFTLVLVGLVTAAMGAEAAFAVSALGVCAVGFGFFYLLFTGGSHFGITVANSLAVYACLFEFFREANFAAAPRAVAIAGLALPMLAFLTYYSLLVVVFTCLYRIADMTMGGTQFRVEGHAGALSFTDAFYFSLMTIATVGYGDIAPQGPLVRALAAVEIVLGVMLLLFGFAEIMRARRRLSPEGERTDRDRP